MPDAPKKRSNLLQFALIFAIVYFGSQLVLRFFFPDQFGDQQALRGIVLKASNVTEGHHPVVTVENHTATGFVLVNRCPSLPPFDVYRIQDGKKTLLTGSGATRDEGTECEPPPVVEANGKEKIELSPWKYALFSERGIYEVQAVVTPQFAAQLQSAGSGSQLAASTLSARLEVSEPGVFTKLFRTFITKPLLNALIFIAGLLPGHSLGWAIVILTIIVKLILFIPTQHALEGQKKMQMLQPKLDALKAKHGNDQKKIQEETMKLWKEHNINPLQSCLPTLIQFPILIGLFYTIRDGSNLELSKHLIYGFYQHLDWTFHTEFFGLNLLKPNWYVLPILLVILQFLQMKLSFAIIDRKKAKKDAVIDVGAKDEKSPKQPMSASKMQQNLMLYLLPLLIGYFALQFPAAVAIYWGVSTLFGIGQQIIVNREHLRV